MKVSNKVLDLCSSDKFQVTQGTDDSILINFKFHKIEINLFYRLESDALVMQGTDQRLEDPYQGFLIGLLELVDNRPIGALNRVSAKELDYYLRDTKEVPAIEFYDNKFLDLLSLPSELYKKLKGSSEQSVLIFADYAELSFSEQVEAFEEFLADSVYSQPLFEDLQFDVEDVEDEMAKLKVNRPLSSIQIMSFKQYWEKTFPNCHFRFL